MKTITMLRFAKLCSLAGAIILLDGASLIAQPVITNQPLNQTNVLGATALFSVGATGMPPLAYQWRRYTSAAAFGDIPGATNTTLMLSNVTPTSHRFVAVVTDATNGITLSRQATLTVIGPPTIQPTNPPASLFADVRFTGIVTAAGPVTYQWLLNGAAIPGAVTNTLSVTNIQKTNAGDYALVVNYTFGSATSQVSRLKIVPFNSIYWFDFSWTDTHNCNWQPPNMYYRGRACNGPLWSEFISTNLGLPYVEANNYSFCGSGPEDMLMSVRQFPIPAKAALSLYCRWVNYDEIPPTAMERGNWDSIIRSQMLNESNVIQTLYSRGARQILVNEVFDVSKLPFKFPESTNVPSIADYGEFKRRLNDAFFEVMKGFSHSKPDVRIIWVEMFEKLNEVIANPAPYGFTEATIDALSDPALSDKSFNGPGADYVFWNSAHGTTKVQRLITSWVLEALTNAAPETLEARLSTGTLHLQMNHLLIGRDYTLQRSTDLSHWSDAQTFTAAAGTNQFTQVTTTGETSVFYRLQWQP